MNVYCVAAGFLGAFLGYVLNWALRHNPKPDAKEVIALVGLIVGGAAVQLVKKGLFKCDEALAWYLIGAGLGFFIFTVALWLRWEKIKKLIDQKTLDGVPFTPFRFW